MNRVIGVEDAPVRWPAYRLSMLRALRIALLLALTFLALGLIIAAGGPETGPVEKVILVGALIAVLAAGSPVRRIGVHS